MTSTSPTEATPVAAPVEQSPASDTQAVEAAAPASGEEETTLLGGSVEAQPEGEGEAAKGDEPAHVVPEKYELSVDGLELDAAAIEMAEPVFKDLNLSNEQANKLMPVAAQFREKVETETRAATLKELVDGHAQQKSEWFAATKADPEIGGGKLDETVHLAAKALDHFGHPEGSDFRKLLTETGFGNHPEMVRLMRSVGEMLSEDGFVRANAGGSTAPKPLHERLYPSEAKGV
ncbi:hypothetical protein ASE49_09255 [Novosphingobium sp. Leaf2]|nr:hypothetical protein ASE49_09255 [Novosphingobium sp. Leaf2]